MTDDPVLRALRKEAGRLLRRGCLPPGLEFGDLVSEGWLGYASGLTRVRADGGASPTTFAMHRARGAMRDAIRTWRGAYGSVRQYPDVESYNPRVHDRAGPVVDEPDDRWPIVLAALACIAPRQREVVERLMLREEKRPAVAAAMGIGLESVSVVRVQALTRLRALVAA